MKRHPEGTEKLIDTRDKRRRDRELRIMQDPKIMQSLKRDQRQECTHDEEPHAPHRRQVA